MKMKRKIMDVVSVSSVSQDTIVRYIFGSSTINSAATSSQTARAATYASDNVEWTNTGVLSETEAHERVNVRFQMYIIGMRNNTSNSGHMYVVHGSNGTQLRIYNTLNGMSQWVEYSQLTTSFDGYSWRETICVDD